MLGETADGMRSLEEELKAQLSENEKLRRENLLFRQEHRILGSFSALIFLGPGLVASISKFIRALGRREGLPVDEAAELAAAVIRRMLNVGLIGLLFASVIPAALLVWQNLLIASQNRYFRAQNEQLQKQIDQERENTKDVRRSDVLSVLYDREPCLNEDGVPLEETRGSFFNSGEKTAAEEAWLESEKVASRPRDCPRSNVRARSEAARAFVKIAWDDIGDRHRTLPCKNPPLAPDLSGVDLIGGDISFSKLDCVKLGNAYLNAADLRDSSLKGVYLSGSMMRNALLSGSNMAGCYLSGVNLREAKLIETNLAGCKIVGSFLAGAQFDRAKLQNADLSRSDFLETSFEDADLRGADLSDGTNLTTGQLEKACLDERTRLPAGVLPPTPKCPAGFGLQESTG